MILSRWRVLNEKHNPSSTLAHKHIRLLLSVWYLAFSSWPFAEMPFIVLEYLEGTSLLALIAEFGRLPWKRALKIGMQVAEAMEHVHAAGVLHRDLKPSNIIVQDSPEPDFVKVVDFGLSKLLGREEEIQKLTRTGELVGTVEYMSPELCVGQRADRRSDIYSLAAVLYECLVGKPPHTADNPVAVIFKHANQEPTVPSVCLSEKLPAGLDEVIMKALAKILIFVTSL